MMQSSSTRENSTACQSHWPTKASLRIVLAALPLLMAMIACAVPAVQPTAISTPEPTAAPPAQPTATTTPEPTATPPAQPTATATPSLATLEPVGQADGGSKAVAIQGHYAYLNVGPRLVVLDIADLTQPTVVGQSPPLPGFESVTVSESHAYIAGEDGLHVIDVSDPTAPAEVGFCATTAPAWSVAVVESTAYVAAGDGLYILDISNPMAPASVGFHDTPDAALEVILMGNTAYVAEVFTERDDATERGGLRILDVADPANPREIGYYPLYPRESGYNRIYEPMGARAVAVAGSYAYVIFGSGKKGGLCILDISDPSNPIEIGDYQDYIAMVSDVAVVGSPTDSEPVYAYLATGPNYGLMALDVSDPAQPASLGTQVTGMAQSIAVAGNILFVTDERGGLHVADISDPAHAVKIGFFDPHGVSLEP